MPFFALSLEIGRSKLQFSILSPVEKCLTYREGFFQGNLPERPSVTHFRVKMCVSGATFANFGAE